MRRFNLQLDFLYSLLATIRAVGIASLTKSAKWNAAMLALGPLKAAGIIDMHAVLFYEISHPTQGMSDWGYATGAFANWLLFSDAFSKAVPLDFALQSFRERKIPLLIFIFFNMLLSVCLSILGIIISYLGFYLMSAFFATTVFLGNNDLVNIPFFLGVLFLAYFFGASLGALVKTLAKIFPPLTALAYVCMPPLFLLSGIYTSYVYMPDIVQDWMLYSPMLPIIEYGRHALHPGYYASESTLYYPLALACLFFVIFNLIHNVSHNVGERSH